MLNARRRVLVLLDYERLSKDLALHVEQLQLKLVAIMQDRLAAATRALVSEAPSWGYTPLRQGK